MKKPLSIICFLTGLCTISNAALIVAEQFETDGDGGTNYLSSAFNDGADYFNRHDYAAQNPHPQQVDQTLLSVGGGAHTNWAWAMEDITDSNNPLGSAGPAVLRLNDVDISGFTNITVTIEVAAIFNLALANDGFDTSDGLDIQAALGLNGGGTAGAANPTLLNGTYTTIGSFRGQGPIGSNPSLAPREVSSGTVLSNQLQDFTFNIADGDTLSLQVVGVSLDGSDEFVFDNIRIEGDAVPEPSSSMLIISGLTFGLIRRKR